MTRCRLSPEGKRRGFNPRKQDREGEFLGPYQAYISSGPYRGTYRINSEVVRVRWDGNKSISSYHRDFIEIIEEK
jgi:hypothetical protein